MNVHVELETMKFHAFHGVSPQERAVGNDFTVDLAYVAAGTERALLSDDIRDAVSYADVFDTVRTEMNKPSQLLEHLAGRILAALKSRFPRLTYIKIKVSKLNPPLGGEVRSASVTLEESAARR
ncbi:MAG: dihydroneopterin aldolase [Tannerella sp.]|jgi:dihydroneopterin aldolase|nr:dihydroneopterin aldolase [Tannerella sp.]